MLPRTLGPRGDVGVNAMMVAKPLANLELIVEYSQKYGPTRSQSRGDGTQWIIACSSMGGQQRPNAKRREARDGRSET